MDDFLHLDGLLHCEEIALDALADEVSTPAYVYSTRTIRRHIRRLREAFAPADPHICYAVKANANLAVLRLFVDEGTGFDIVSGGELSRVLRVGGDPSRVVFSGVGKTEAEMVAALEAGIRLFNVESEEELDVLAGVAARIGRVAPVAIRVNPDVDPKTHRYVTTGRKENKFGVDLDRAARLARRARALESVTLRGLQCHIGSQITTVEPYVAAVEKTLALAKRLRAEGDALATFDMGGGFGITYDDPDVAELDDYARAVMPLLEGSGLELLMEPGRVIVGNAGVLLTRVLFNKVSGEKRFVIVDAGMNDLIRPALYGGGHRIWPVRGESPPPLGEVAPWPPCDIVGPVCETGDFLARDRPLPPLARGDLLAVRGVGAYGFTMASNYNERPRPGEVLVGGAPYGGGRG
ncbi:MAG: diaminopimelate decarboxylase, partial [Planctomycetota bacterium]